MKNYIIGMFIIVSVGVQTTLCDEDHIAYATGYLDFIIDDVYELYECPEGHQVWIK